MAKRVLPLLVLGAVVLASTAYVATSGAAADPEGLVAHEWGTFTTVAGVDGKPVDWLPLSGPSDLPCFVERLSPASVVKGFNATASLRTYDAAKQSLVGKVRMETPVIYFYSAKPVRADVRVIFPHGLMTEWYPKAIVAVPPVQRDTLRDRRAGSVIEWRGVDILPSSTAAFPTEPGGSHYYAARTTDAAPIRLNGQVEKFLFYRGVAGFDVPLTAEALPGGSVRLTNLGERELRSVILFENRDGRLGYTIHGTLQRQATMAAPALTANIDALRADLERHLIDAGLYPKEARAMVETWRDSWFEEGARVFYVLAPQAVDAILPLSITPAAARVERVFVGRMDVITPHTLTAVRHAIARGSSRTIERYGRLLGPIAERLAADTAVAGERTRILDTANAALTAIVNRGPACAK